MNFTLIFVLVFLLLVGLGLAAYQIRGRSLFNASTKTKSRK